MKSEALACPCKPVATARWPSGFEERRPAEEKPLGWGQIKQQIVLKFLYRKFNTPTVQRNFSGTAFRFKLTSLISLITHFANTCERELAWCEVLLVRTCMDGSCNSRPIFLNLSFADKTTLSVESNLSCTDWFGSKSQNTLQTLVENTCEESSNPTTPAPKQLNISSEAHLPVGHDTSRRSAGWSRAVRIRLVVLSYLVQQHLYLPSE